eukprot:6349851-Prymnesium_polylepis.1
MSRGCAGFFLPRRTGRRVGTGHWGRAMCVHAGSRAGWTWHVGPWRAGVGALDYSLYSFEAVCRSVVSLPCALGWSVVKRAVYRDADGQRATNVNSGPNVN